MAADGLDFLKVGGGSLSCSVSAVKGGNDGILKIDLRLDAEDVAAW